MEAAAGFWGDEPAPSPSPLPPSPSPLPPGPDEPDDPYDLPDDLVVPFILLAFFLVAMAGMMSGLTLVGARACPPCCRGVAVQAGALPAPCLVKSATTILSWELYVSARRCSSIQLICCCWIFCFLQGLMSLDQVDIEVGRQRAGSAQAERLVLAWMPCFQHPSSCPLGRALLSTPGTAQLASQRLPPLCVIPARLLLGPSCCADPAAQRHRAPEAAG